MSSVVLLRLYIFSFVSGMFVIAPGMIFTINAFKYLSDNSNTIDYLQSDWAFPGSYNEWFSVKIWVVWIVSYETQNLTLTLFYMVWQRKENATCYLTLLSLTLDWGRGFSYLWWGRCCDFPLDTWGMRRREEKGLISPLELKNLSLYSVLSESACHGQGGRVPQPGEDGCLDSLLCCFWVGSLWYWILWYLVAVEQLWSKSFLCCSSTSLLVLRLGKAELFSFFLFDPLAFPIHQFFTLIPGWTRHKENPGTCVQARSAPTSPVMYSPVNLSDFSLPCARCPHLLLHSVERTRKCASVHLPRGQC